MEWPISFRKGSERKTALVQIGDGHLVVLCQISAMYYKIPPRLLAILNDPNTCKIGVNVRGDALKLQRDFGHSIRGFLDLSHLARAVDPISSGPGKSVGLPPHVCSIQSTPYPPFFLFIKIRSSPSKI